MIGLMMSIGFCFPAFADDWQAIKLRGAVFTLVDNAWVQLVRGDVVTDERIIRTAPNGRVQFRRDKETIDLGPDTQIRIFDRDGQQFTVVQEHFGEVAVEVERREVQHFVVQTRYLAAVVKGTRFTVKADENQTSVKVNRGQVEVRDVAHGLMVDVTPGQSASVGSTEVLSVSGSGTYAPIVKFSGKPLAANVTAFETAGPGEVNGNVGDNSSGNNAGGNSNGAGNSANSNAGGKSPGNNAGGSSNGAGKSASSNAGGNSSGSNAGGNSNGAGQSANSNAGGNSSGNNAGGNSNGAGNSANSNAGGNSSGNNAGGNSNGAGNSANSNAGGNSSGNNAGGNSNGAGNSANSNAGGNGKKKS